MFTGTMVLVSMLASGPVASDISLDLTHVGHLPSKGRVQDQVPQNGIVAALVRSGPESIPFLVEKLTDEREVSGVVLDLWPKVHVGDVALIILCDLLTVADQSGSAVPGMTWDNLLERSDTVASASAVLARFLGAHGRAGLQNKVIRLLEPYQGQFGWDSHERCFRPGVAPPN